MVLAYLHANKYTVMIILKLKTVDVAGEIVWNKYVSFIDMRKSCLSIQNVS